MLLSSFWVVEVLEEVESVFQATGDRSERVRVLQVETTMDGVNHDRLGDRVVGPVPDVERAAGDVVLHFTYHFLGGVDAPHLGQRQKPAPSQLGRCVLCPQCLQ